MQNIFDIQSLQQFDNFEFIARHIVEGFINGLHRSPYHGFSVEFAEHRSYNQGESTRHIDWKLYARTDKLFIKKYEEETNLKCHIAIDTSSSMLFPYKDSTCQNKLAFSSFCAAALIYLLRKQRDAVGLTLFSETVDLHTEAKLSSIHAQRLFNELSELVNHHKAETSLNKGTSIADSLHHLAENISTRSLVIIFSDMFDQAKSDELFSALQHLRFKKHEVIVFHVVDRNSEQDFKFENRPHKFISLETGEEFRVNPGEIKAMYKEKVGDYFELLKTRCTQYQIDFVEVDIIEDFRNVLLTYLIKRNKLN
jgi:uncharacterized protein (DUF58 family)